MKKFYLTLVIACVAMVSFAQAPFKFNVEVDPKEYGFVTDEVVVSPSPLTFQVLFVGGSDKVQVNPIYDMEAQGEALAKQWHDFIGFTPDPDSEDLGWVSVNHEMIVANDSIGDGGGMTVFKIKRSLTGDRVEIVEQTLADGREGDFFNVDFVETVGNTGMNCGGIVGPEGRIWTAEEWFRSSNESIEDRDLGQFTIAEGTTENPITDATWEGTAYDGEVVEKFENYNWMVEIDPREAKAITKQYNWGRQAFEGGAFLDNTTVFLSEDATPGLFTKYVTSTPGDFTDLSAGTFYVFKHDEADATNGNWVEIDISDFDNMLNVRTKALEVGATIFNRLEWSAEIDGKIYMTETGRSGVGSRWANAIAAGGQLSPHIIPTVRERHPELVDKPDEEVLQFVADGFFRDYYGRVLEYDPATDEVTTYLDGGPYFESSPEMAAYPEKHLSNPDGLSSITINPGEADEKTFMLICEDLNQTSNGSVPAGVSNRTCELYMLDMEIADPTVEDLIRIGIVPAGAEVTGAIGLPDGKTILVNSQHPSENNPFPYNNSLTFAINNWDFAVSAIDEVTALEEDALGRTELSIYPNPVAQTVNFNKIVDVALYDINGKRVRVVRNTKSLDVIDLPKGTYLLKTSTGETRKLVVAQEK